jgi:AcrR family transcriptional regulator
MTDPRDREEQRNRVAQLAARLIAERGLEAVKVREIAAELGYSTHIVSHYFDSKKELLLLTLRLCAARQVKRLKLAISSNESLVRCLEALLPLDEERMVDARVWIMFWAQTFADRDIAAVQLEFGARWRRLLVGTLRIRGHFTPDTPRATRDLVAQRLQTAVAGIGVHGALGVWPAERQRELLAQEVDAALATLDPSDRQPLPPPDLRSEPVGDEPSSRRLAIENTRLRKLLVDAMLQIETLHESRPAEDITYLRNASR